jgi:glycosyltransferase involved in cell wall biosynthesis
MGMHSSKYGGIEKFMVILAKELNINNISLIVIYNSEPSSKEFSNDIAQAGGKIIIAHAMHPIRYFIGFVKLFVSYKPILVHAHFQVYYSIIFAKLLGCRKIFMTLHGMIIDDGSKYVSDVAQLPSSTRLFRKIINKITYGIFSVSDAVKNQYTILFPAVGEKIRTLYLGSMPINNLPELSTMKLNIDSDKVIIGTIGFNSPIKGLDILMDAMVILKNEFNCTSFLVYQIGIDPLDTASSKYVYECEQKGLKDMIKWMGIRNDTTELLAGMNIYCQPSRSEALGLAIVEAGMAGLPIVGSRVGGIPEIVKENFNGFLFDNGNAYQLAEILFRLISDPELRGKMGENSKEYLMINFNINRQTKALCNQYLTALNLK